jgi:hypothetical protein
MRLNAPRQTGICQKLSAQRLKRGWKLRDPVQKIAVLGFTRTQSVFWNTHLQLLACAKLYTLSFDPTAIGFFLSGFLSACYFLGRRPGRHDRLEAYGKVKSCEGWLGTPVEESFIPFRCKVIEPVRA